VSAPEAICSRFEDVRRGEQVGQLIDREEAVVERDVSAEAELDDGIGRSERVRES
jgi:hypothetical protein